MKAVILHGPGSVSVGEFPTPVPKAGEVRVRVAFCGICRRNTCRLRNRNTCMTLIKAVMLTFVRAYKARYSAFFPKG